MSKHTQGPWKVNKHPVKSIATGEMMYDVDGPDVVFDYERTGFTEKSARLIAAAPDLLEALCSVMLCEFNSMSSRQEMVRIARAAIAKATKEAS